MDIEDIIAEHGDYAMSRFKKDILYELHNVKLTEDRKQIIIQQAHQKRPQRKQHSWHYRAVLLAFTIGLVFFGYLLTQTSTQRTASQPTITSWNPFVTDMVKGVCILCFIVGATIILKRVDYKRGIDLPSCIACGEQWSVKQARRVAMSNDNSVTCPYCQKKQYRVMGQKRWMNRLYILIPITIFCMNMFQHFWIGIAFYGIGALWWIYYTTPYSYDLQEEEKPLW
ncbi:TIGR04104 family putative zinc finger protein [Lysinibacillus piscis]|uniref:Cxxc_20_cxxc protein n=1 Tax=Lysinibacillus piscis TaxID=2518931 RepID=A0ABQ5NKL2_9BACI|nr:TIGR04104 family putative zinc finger protein [Lysinibacillus sp. KH24]GLC88838.1 hypothetical protein LYSBPC_19650 [Lysinibacillus sp. KH24]